MESQNSIQGLVYEHVDLDTEIMNCFND